MRVARQLTMAALVLASATGAALAQGVGAARAFPEIIARGDIPGATRSDLPHYRAALTRLYLSFAGSPLWQGAAGPTPQADSVIAVLLDATSRGLRPEYYDAISLSREAASLRATNDPQRAARFDVWLSLATMRYLEEVHHGRVDPRTLGFALQATEKRLDYPSLLAAMARIEQPRAMMRAVEPQSERYVLLEDALARYRQLAADPSLQPPPWRKSVKPDAPWDGVPALRHFLTALGDLPNDASVSDTIYTGALVDAVRLFQRRHGLADDGVIGPATIAAMRVPLSSRVTQIELTLERWRWLPAVTPERFAVVNIPGYRLTLIDRSTLATTGPVRMDVIVGRSWGGKRRTPVFLGTIRYVIFHPYWDVPPSIARKEVVPDLLRHPALIESEGYEILDGERRVAVTEANLWRVSAGAMRIRQRPGPKNPLGQVKFVFPNAYNVYLHGTPAQSLFAQSRRDFSHGCIRVSNPPALAKFVLQNEGGWTPEAIAAAMSGVEQPRTVPLSQPIPVYIIYATVVPLNEREVDFYADVYGHDARLARALGLPGVEQATIAARAQ